MADVETKDITKEGTEVKAEYEIVKSKAAPKHLGIPEAVFVEDVDKFMQEAENSSAEVVLKRFEELYNKYKYMEISLTQKKRRLRNQIPDIQKSLDAVNFVKSKQGSGEQLTTHYLLSDAVYSEAEIPIGDTVYLWLGANVMLEYPVDDAIVLLSKNLESAKSSLLQVDEDLDFLKDQCTTIEVDMARVYNWDVKERRKAKKI